MRLHNRQGFTLLEITIVLLIISILNLLTLSYFPNTNLNNSQSETFKQQLIFTQLSAMAKMKKIYLHHSFSSNQNSLFFNQMGNVNAPQTIHIDDSHHIVIQLGFGRFYEK